MQSRGYRIVPVNPRYAADGGEILGEKVYADLAGIPFQVDSVDVFRRSEDVLPIARQVAQYLQDDPRVAWVNYPDLPDHPQYDLVQSQMRNMDDAPSASGLLSFGVKGGLDAGVLPDMVRMSVVIEPIDDILWDIDQALSASGR